MRAVAILGTYHHQGIISSAAEALLRGAAAAGAETETFFLVDHRIGYCRNCRTCSQGQGEEPGVCVQDDDMPALIRAAASADLLVLGSPVNVGSTTAVTKTFTERLVTLYKWSWGDPMPRRRRFLAPGRVKAVLLTSSLAPAPVGRALGFTALAQLRDVAHLFHAEIVAERWYGNVGRERGVGLSATQLADAEALGQKVIAGALPRLRWPDLGFEAERLSQHLPDSLRARMGF